MASLPTACLLLALSATPGHAQSTDPDQSAAGVVPPTTRDIAKPTHPKRPPAKPAHAARPAKPPPKAATPAGKTPAGKTAATTAPRPPLTIPPAAPPPPQLPPPIVVPVRPPAAPIPATIVADAPGRAIPQRDGLRLTFGSGASALNPATEAAVRLLAHDNGPFNTATFTVTAYAAGAADDPSAARRLSLSRALAVRSILITEGVASVRIYVKALGAAPADDQPADRVDIVTAQNLPPPKPTQ